MKVIFIKKLRTSICLGSQWTGLTIYKNLIENRAMGLKDEEEEEENDELFENVTQNVQI